MIPIGLWPGGELQPRPDQLASEPPVVARLVIEVRSDGSHSIARGAVQVEGEGAAVEAHGDTPAELVRALVKSALAQVKERAQATLHARGTSAQPSPISRLRDQVRSKLLGPFT